MKSFFTGSVTGIALCGYLLVSASVAAPAGMGDLERAMDEAAAEIVEAELGVAGADDGASGAANALTIREALDLAIGHAPKGSEIRSIERLELDGGAVAYFAVYGETIVTRTREVLQADGGYAPEPRHRAMKVGVLVGQEGTVKKAVTEDRLWFVLSGKMIFTTRCAGEYGVGEDREKTGVSVISNDKAE